MVAHTQHIHTARHKSVTLTHYDKLVREGEGVRGSGAGGCLGEDGQSPSWWGDAGGPWNGEPPAWPPSREGDQANIHRLS